MAHFSVPRGKRALVIMKNGDHVLAFFEKEEGKWMYFRDHEPIRKIHARTVSIYKPKENK